MASPLTPAQRRSLALSRLNASADWSSDPLVQAFKEKEAQKIAAEKLAAEAASRPDFSNVISGSDSTALSTDAGLLEAMGHAASGWVDSAQGSLQSTLAGIAQLGADKDAVLEQEDYSRTNPRLLAAQQQVAQLFSFLPTAVEGLISGPEAASRRLREEGGFAGAAGSIADEQLSKAEDNQNRAAAATATAQAYNSANLPSFLATPANEFSEAATDLSGSLASMASIFGGPYGAGIAGASSFFPTYAEARKKLSPTDAMAYSLPNALIETALAKTPSERLVTAPLEAASRKFLGREFTDVVSSDAAKIAGRTLATASGEAVNEAATTVTQLAANKAIADADDGNLGKYASEQLPKNVWDMLDQVWRSSKAGFLGGSTISTPTNIVQVTAERGRMAGDALAGQASSMENINRARSERRARRLEEEAQRQFEERKAAEEAERQEFRRFEEEQVAREAGRNELQQATGTRNPAEAFLQSPVPNLNFPFGPPVANPARGNAVPDEAAMDAQIQREAAAAAADQEAATALEQRDAEALKKARTNHSKRRTTAKKNIAEQAQALPKEERTAFVRNTLAQWDSNNPVPTEESISTPVAPVSEAEQLVKSADADALKKLTDAHKTARNKVAADVVSSVRSLPEADRAGIVQTALADWDAANPAPTAESARATPTSQLPSRKGTQGRRGRSVANAAPSLTAEEIKALIPDASEQEVAAAQQEGQDKLSQLRQQAADNPLPSETAGETTDTTPDEVMKSILGKLKSSDGKVVAKLLADGNTVIVPDVSYVPGNAAAAGAGFYDGNTTYIVANKLSKDNTFADVLEISTHEGRHAGDIGASPQVKRVMGGVIGDKAVKSQAQLIRNLASSNQPGNDLAKQVLSIIPKDTPASTLDYETVAYFTQLAANAENSKGSVARIKNNLVSAARTTSKRLLGAEADVNINDLAYLGKKLLREQAISGERQTGALPGSNAMPMVVGADTPTGRRLQEQGVPAVTDVDGMNKVIASDIDSELTLPPNFVKALNKGKTFRVGDVLSNPSINESYPELNDATIVRNKNLKEGAQWNDANKTLSISDKELELADAGQASEDALHAIMLHELQHGIQGIEGFAGGGDPKQFRTAADRALIAKNNKAANDWKTYVNNLHTELDDLELDRGQRGEILQDIAMWNNDELTPEQLEGRLISALGESPTRRAQTLARELQEYLDKWFVLRPDIDEMSKRTLEQYHKLRGEQESYYVQAKLRTPQDQLAAQVPGGEDSIVARFGEELPSEQPSTGPLPSVYLGNIGQRYKSSDFARKVKAVVLPHGGLGYDLFDQLQSSRGEAGTAAHQGERSAARVDRGVKLYAKEKGISVDDAQKLLREKMDKINLLPSADLRRRAYENLARTEPTLAPIYEAQSDIANFTDQIIIGKLRANPNPTPDDIKLYNQMLDNQYKYVTRVYSAFQGKAGKKYVNSLMADIASATTKLGKRKKLSAAEQDAYTRWTDAVDYVEKHQLTVPNDEDINAIDNNRLEYLYNSWVGTGTEFQTDFKNALDEARRDGLNENESYEYARAKMIDAIEAESKNADPLDLRSKAEDAVRDLLGVNTKASGGAVGNSIFGPLNNSILKKRTDIPAPLRRVLGEIIEPSTLIALTMSKQGELVARQKFLNMLRDNYNGKWVVPPTSGTRGEFTTVLDGAKWGSLKGWRAKPEIAALLGETYDVYQSFGDAVQSGFNGIHNGTVPILSPVLRGVRKGASGMKLASVVLDPFNVGMNLLGSVGFLAQNGVLNPKYVIQGVGVSWDSVKNNMLDQEGSLTPLAQSAIKYGILESVRVNELKQASTEHVKRRVSQRTAAGRAKSAVGKGYRVARNTAVDIFAQTDVWPKVAAFAERVDVMKKYYELQGIKKTDAQIEQEAATFIKRTNTSSDRTPPFVKYAEALGLTTFANYFYNIPRSMMQSGWMGAMDIKRAFTEGTNPEAKRLLAFQGIKRLAGTAAASYGFALLTKAMADAMNGDDDDEVAELAKMLPTEQRFGDLVKLGEDEDGTARFLRLSRLDGNGPVNDLIRIALDDNSTWEDIRGHVGDALSGMLFANRFTGVVLESASTAVTGGRSDRRDTRLGRLLPGTVGAIRDMSEDLAAPGTFGGNLSRGAAEFVVRGADALTPGWLDAFDPKNPNVVPNKEGGEDLGRLIILSGGKLDAADPNARASNLSFGLNDIRKEGRTAVDDARRRGDDEAALDIMQTTDQRVYAKLKEFTDLYQGMTKGAGMSSHKAMEVLKNSGGLDSTDIAMIVRGEVPRHSATLNALGRALDERSMISRSKQKERSRNITRQKQELEDIREFKRRLEARKSFLESEE